MVTPFAVQSLFKTKLAVIRVVTMCWKHPHPLSLDAPFFLECTSARWHLILWAILGGCWFRGLPVLRWAWTEISFLPVKHILSNSSGLCVEVSTSRGACCSRALGWSENTRVKSIAVAEQPNHMVLLMPASCVTMVGFSLSWFVHL